MGSLQKIQYIADKNPVQKRPIKPSIPNFGYMLATARIQRGQQGNRGLRHCFVPYM